LVYRWIRPTSLQTLSFSHICI